MIRKERPFLVAAISAAALCSTVACDKGIQPDAHAAQTAVAAPQAGPTGAASSQPASATTANAEAVPAAAPSPEPVPKPAAVPTLRRMTGNTKSPSYADDPTQR